MPKKITDFDPETLRKMALDPNTPCRTTAQLLGVSTTWLFRYRKANGLPGREHFPRGSRDGVGVRKDIPEEILRQLLLVDKLTNAQVCEKLGCSLSKLLRLQKMYRIPAAKRGARPGAGHKHSWRGGRHLDRDGYWRVHAPNHPHVRKSGYVLEHRLVMEKHLGRYLDPKEVVHHKDDNPQNNSIENLELFACNADHLRHELTGRRWGSSTRVQAHRHRRKAPADISNPAGSESGAPPSQSDSLKLSEPQTSDQLP